MPSLPSPGYHGWSLLRLRAHHIVSTHVDTASLARELRAGERRALARAITLIESTRADHRASAVGLLNELGTAAAPTLRVGISGVPGVGKSTFIDVLGCHVCDAGHRVAVLTIDPSSARSGGSILGDKTRMPQLALRDEAFIRPSPTSGALGGVGRHTRETVLICEAAGFDVVLVETVGVGQSEVSVANMTDVFLLLLLPGGGDELQGIKRGIMELADVVMINKADGDLVDTARQTAADYANAIRLLQPKYVGWQVPVEAGSALHHEGVEAVWSHIRRYAVLLRESGQFDRQRTEQAVAGLWDGVRDSLRAAIETDHRLSDTVADLEHRVRERSLPATVAAERLVAAFLSQRSSK